MKKEVLTEHEAERFLKRFLPVARNQLVKNLGQVSMKKYPLVLKIMSKQALHKSDINGVRIVHNNEDLVKNFDDLLKIAKKKKLKLQGILVQEYKDGYQFIVGGKKDPTFGQVILVGGGGVFTELMEDVSIRACPIIRRDAEQMLKEVKYSKVLEGFRGSKKGNVNKLIKFLVDFSRLMNKHQNIEELDINPLIVNSKEVVAVDARMVVSK